MYIFTWLVVGVKYVTPLTGKSNRSFLSKVNPDGLPSFSGLQIPHLLTAQSSSSPTSP